MDGCGTVVRNETVGGATKVNVGDVSVGVMISCPRDPRKLVGNEMTFVLPTLPVSLQKKSKKVELLS